MTIKDLQDLALTGADAASAEHYTRALHQFSCYIEDPVASVDAAIAQSPGFVMAHVGTEQSTVTFAFVVASVQGAVDGN